MKIEVTNCMNCPFVVEDIDYDSTGKEVCISCNLLKFFKIGKEWITIFIDTLIMKNGLKWII